MKIILLQNIPKVGKKFDVKDVSDGHALNFLIPRGLAEIATPNALKHVEGKKAADEGNRKVRDEMIAKNLHELEGKTIEIEEKANDKGHLFAGIKAEELAGIIKTQTSLDVSPEHIMLDKPLKEVGEHKVKMEVDGKSATLTIHISAK